MKTLNNKGFTVVELLTSFALASVVMILLTNILLAIKENYLQKKMEVELDTQLALLSQTLNDTAYNCVINSWQPWGRKNNFADSASCNLQSMQLTTDNEVAIFQTIDKNGNTKINKYEFPEGVTFSNGNITSLNMGSNGTYLLVEFDINATMPVTRDTKTKQVKVLYKYER